MKKTILYAILSIFCLISLTANEANHARKVTIIGGGIIGALESYHAYKDARKNEVPICITVYEKGDASLSTNTAYNIVPSLTIDEILSVVPRGSEMVEKLSILFSEPGGIRVDDVADLNNSLAAKHFKDAVAIYGTDPNHDDRTQTLLKLGKMSIESRQDIVRPGGCRSQEHFSCLEF